MICGILGGQASQACTLVKIAEWPVKLESGVPIVSATINGKDVRVLLDTGAAVSLLDRSAAARLGVEVTRADGWEVYGVGGRSEAGAARLAEFRIGKAVRADWDVLVAGERIERTFDFILGDDFLEQVDLELDYPKGFVRLFQPQGCGKRSLGYWDPKNALQVPIEPGPKVHVAAYVNGERVIALVDTGYGASAVSARFARSVGVTGGDSATRGCAWGLGPGVSEVWSAPFKSVQVGPQVIHNPVLKISENVGVDRKTTERSRIATSSDPTTTMVIGSDFLRAHRVLISRSQRMMYFTHAGGMVFPDGGRGGNCAAGAAAPYEAELKLARERQDKAAVERTLARIEEVVRDYGRDAVSLGGRGYMWSRFGEPARALADYDAALALDPGNTDVRWERGLLKMNARRWDEARPDIEAVLAANPRGVGVLFNMALIEFETGAPDRALARVEEALRIKPDFVAALSFRGDIWAGKGDDLRALAEWDRAEAASAKAALNLRRGRAYFRLGRFDDASREFSALKPGTSPGHLYNPIFKYLAAGRAGRDGRVTLRSEVDTMTGWPRSIARFHLGDLDETALLAAASTDPGKGREQECEAHFNIAQRWMLAAQPERARPWFERARDQCPKTYFEYLAAVAELRRL